MSARSCLLFDLISHCPISARSCRLPPEDLPDDFQLLPGALCGPPSVAQLASFLPLSFVSSHEPVLP